jgi:hypothetical protein
MLAVSVADKVLLGKLVFGSTTLVRPRWRPSVYVRLRSHGKTFRCTGANKTLMPPMPCEFCCAGMIARGGAYLRCRRYGWPCSGDEGPRGPGTRRASRGHRVRGRWRRGQGVRGGATPPVLDCYFGAEGAAILDTWLPPTCKVGSGRGRDKGGRV